MSIETPTGAEFEKRMETQLDVASRMLGFDVKAPEAQTPENVQKLIDWINTNGSYFKNILEQNDDVWQRVKRGEANTGDIGWIIAQMKEYDLGAEDHESDREMDA